MSLCLLSSANPTVAIISLTVFPIRTPLPLPVVIKTGLAVGYHLPIHHLHMSNLSLISRPQTHGMHKEHYTSQNPTHDQAKMVDPCPIGFVHFAYLSRF